MKKQINPTIKAYLLRSAFYLLLFLAVCAIPFALAQRNTTKRSLTKPIAKANVVANMKDVPRATGSQTFPVDASGVVSAQTQVQPKVSAAAPSYAGPTSRSDVPFLRPLTVPFPKRPAGVGCALDGTLGTAPPGGETGTIAVRIFRPGTPTVMCGIAP